MNRGDAIHDGVRYTATSPAKQTVKREERRETALTHA